MTGEKLTFRKQLLAQRQSLSQPLYDQLSHQICTNLVAFLEHNFIDGQLLLAYWPHLQEPDLSQLLRLNRYQWGLSRCLPDRQLAWHRWQWGEPLITNRYGLSEPTASSTPIDVQQVRGLLIPAVAIDQSGYRLGYGGGYFDRLLSQQPWSTVTTIGVVFDFAYVPTLPKDNWDQPVTAVSTESGTTVF